MTFVRLNDNKNLEILHPLNETKYEFSYGLETPSVKEGYQGIARKAIGNAILFVGCPAYGAICKGADVVISAMGAVSSVALGTLGLIATPAILAKDLAHHTCRVLNQKFVEGKKK